MDAVRGRSQSRPWVIAAALLAAVTVLRCFAAARLGLGDAEAYYWTWSRQLAIGYLDHGPVVAWLIRLGTAIGGSHSTLAVRAPFILISAATAIGCAALATHLSGSAWAALWALLALVAMPAFLVAGGAANPDVPLVGLTVALLAALIAVVEAARPLRMLALAGFLVGAAISTKLFGLIFLAPLLLAAARLKPPRRLPALLVSAGAALTGALPFLWWNYQHGWSSFRYHLVLRHSQRPGLSLVNLGKLVGGQIAYVSPLLLGGMIVTLVALWRAYRSSSASSPPRALLETSAPPLLVGYALILVIPSAEPHWPIAGYLPLLIALAARMPEAWRAASLVRGLSSAALVMALLLGVGLHIHLLTDLGVRLMPASYVPRFDLSNELYGWPEVIAGLRAQRRSGEPVAGCHYTICSQLAFEAQGAFPILCPSPRLDQFDLSHRGDGSATRGIDLLYVLDERLPYPAQQLYRCRAVEELVPVRVKRGGRTIRTFRIQRCRGFQGLRELRWPPPPH